ncbi:hypothetical protein ACFRAR_13240 [Kitasatospora sp. NPDC056651]|uniref:hypothetical protein n=1 Tax=Kitasatospora sp. NPDC056651 TaxID=3345892 RepID=UPI0036B2DE90
MSTSLNPADITVVRPVATPIAKHDPSRGSDDNDTNNSGGWDSYPFGQYDDRD